MSSDHLYLYLLVSGVQLLDLAAPNHKELVQAFSLADVPLRSNGTYTLFAPTAAAFKALPEVGESRGLLGLIELL